MKKYFLLILSLVLCGYIHAQCLTSSLIINTGYNPISNTAIAGGANGATPVIDPHWIVTAESPGVATAIAGTPIPGLIEVTPGANADVVQPVGAWVTNPAGQPGGWISCLNSNTYTDPGTGIPLNMTLARSFKVCTDDSVRLDFYISDDNSTSAVDVDGVPLPTPSTGFTTFNHFVQTIWLTAGTHTFHIVVVNQNNVGASSNPTGLDIYGTVSSAGGLNSLVSESYASCATYTCGSTCNTISLPDTLHLCENTSDTLRASVVGTDSVLGITWTPVTGLSSSTVLRPLVTVGSTSGWYYITLRSLTPYNLVYNGDFSLGNVGFTSTYTYSPPPSTTLIEGDYSVYTDPHGVHTGFTTMGDHTTGTGNMMIVNGGGTPSSVWCETIPVTPNTDYDFSAWFSDCSAVTTGANDPIMQFMVNGVLLGTPTTISAPPGTWVNFSATWNSGSNTTATICIYDEVTVTSGNDFVIDDISFQQICVAKDSEYVDVHLVDTSYTHHDTAVCAPITAVTLTAPSGYTSYTWSTGATTASVVVNSAGDYWVDAPSACAMLIDTFHVTIAPVDTSYHSYDSTKCASVGSINLTAPSGFTSYQWNTGSTASTISVSTAGTYWVYMPGPCSMLIDTFHVAFNPSPVVNLGNDTAFCQGDSVILTSVQPAGNTYQWSTGSTGDTIHVLSTGTYWLHVSNGCDATDTIHITVDPLPVVDLGPDSNNCTGTPILLQSSVTYPGTYTYLWNTGATTSSITAYTTGTYWLQVFSNAGCSNTDTINVQILYDTVTLHTPDTAICKGQSVQVVTTGNPDYNMYDWIPTTGIATPNVGSPVIYGDTSAEYIMTAHFPGCPDIIDSFYLDVQPNPVNVYIGGNRFVCKGDTIHINATVTPAWYTHYSYTWTPSAWLDNTSLSTVVFTAGDSETVILTVTTPAGCTGVDSAKIFVYPSLIAHADSLFDICPHDSVQFNASVESAGAATYAWYPSMYLDNANIAAPWVHAITSQTYTLVATSQYGCRDTLQVNVIVHPGAVIYMPDSVTLYPGETYQLSPQTNCTSFLWSPPAGLSNIYISDPVAAPAVDTRYFVYGTTMYGCTAKDSIFIYVSPESLLDMPNAFSPGTGPNNLLKIIKRGLATLNYFRIYNRWGNLVYESSDIDAGWDGTYKGKPQPFDVYIYEIEAVTSQGTIFHKHGNITLLR